MVYGVTVGGAVLLIFLLRWIQNTQLTYIVNVSVFLGILGIIINLYYLLIPLSDKIVVNKLSIPAASISLILLMGGIIVKQWSKSSSIIREEYAYISHEEVKVMKEYPYDYGKFKNKTYFLMFIIELLWVSSAAAIIMFIHISKG